MADRNGVPVGEFTEMTVTLPTVPVQAVGTSSDGGRYGLCLAKYLICPYYEARQVRGVDRMVDLIALSDLAVCPCFLDSGVNPVASQESARPPVGILSSTIRLLDSGGVAQFVNPLTFHWNNVVGQDWVCSPGVSVGITRSAFSYTNGLQVEAIGSNVAFKQEGTPLDLSQEVHSGVALRYIEAFELGSCEAISSEFVLRIDPSETLQPQAEVLSRLWDGLKQDEANPFLDVGVRYDSPNKFVEVSIWLDDHPYEEYIVCSGQVYRQLSQQPEQALSELRTVLGNWQSERLEFRGAVVKLLFAIGGLRSSQ